MAQTLEDLMKMFRPEIARYENARFAVSQSYQLVMENYPGSIVERIKIARELQKAMFDDLEKTIDIAVPKEIPVSKTGPKELPPPAKLSESVPAKEAKNGNKSVTA